MLANYFRMLGKRAIRWGTGGSVAAAFMGIGLLAGLREWPLLGLGAIGALAGSVVAEMLMQRLFGAEPPPQPAPRGRGSGRRGS